jgi:hypothetical protein
MEKQVAVGVDFTKHRRFANIRNAPRAAPGYSAQRLTEEVHIFAADLKQKDNVLWEGRQALLPAKKLNPALGRPGEVVENRLVANCNFFPVVGHVGLKSDPRRILEPGHTSVSEGDNIELPKFLVLGESIPYQRPSLPFVPVTVISEIKCFQFFESSQRLSYHDYYRLHYHENPALDAGFSWWHRASNAPSNGLASQAHHFVFVDDCDA